MRRSLRLTAAAVALAAALPAAPASAAPVRAKSADTFMNSLGVNIHSLWGDTPYKDKTRIRAALKDLKVRVVRDSLALDRQDQYDFFKALSTYEGIKANFILGREQARGTYDPKESVTALDRLIPVVDQQLRSATTSVEGHNEYDIKGPTDWVAPLKTHQRALYTKVRGRSTLGHVEVLGPSLGRNASHSMLGDVSTILDHGNEHTYSGGRIPSVNVDSFLSLARYNSAGKPVQSTETGYHHALKDPTTHLPASERASGIYYPRLYLEYFRRGVVRSFPYQLIDPYPNAAGSNREYHFGLLRNDWSQRPAYRAIKNMTTVLNGSRTGFTPGTLDYTLSGDLTNVRQMLLQKADGTFYLALWQEVSVWDQINERDLYPGTRRVRVTLNQPIRRMDAYRPTLQATSRWTVTNPKVLDFNVPADVVLVKLTR